MKTHGAEMDDLTKVLVGEAAKYGIAGLAKGSSALWTRIKNSAFPTSRHEELKELLDTKPEVIEAKVAEVAAQDALFRSDIARLVQNIYIEQGQGGIVFNAPVTIQGGRIGGVDAGTAQAKQPRAESRISNLGLRNRNFTGREEILANLRKTLTEAKSAALTALSGLGGIGKTQVALEYAYRYASEYDVIWWVKAETEASRIADFTELAMKLKLFKEEPKDVRIVVQGVTEWLRSPQGARWLMIFDNAENPESLREFLPSGGGHTLITSRFSAWKGTAEPLEVKKMGKGEAREFLLRRTGNKDKAAADAIADELGCLPLALEQAGAYVDRTGKLLAEYLNLFLAKRIELFKSRLSEPSQDYLYTVLTTWSLSFEAAERQCKESSRFLKLCAFFAPDDIPLEAVIAGAEFLPNDLEACVNNEERLDEAIATLMDYSLVTRSDMNLSLHRLVQEVTRDQMPRQENNLLAQSAIEIVAKATRLPAEDCQTWRALDRLLLHCLLIVEYCDKIEATSDAVVRTLNQCGRYLSSRARFEEAIKCIDRAIAISEKELGKDYPYLANVLNNLGEVLRVKGDFVDAINAYLRALEIDRRSLGDAHPNVGIRLNNIGLVYQSCGDLSSARILIEQALDILIKALGANDPHVALIENNLATLLADLGDLAGAEKYLRKIIEFRRSHPDYGLFHSYTATNINNLGMVLRARGKFSEAKRYIKQALTIGRRLLGEDHPTVAMRLNNLGLVMFDQRNYEGARQCFERALDIFSSTLNADNPYIRGTKWNLESVRMETEKLGNKPRKS